MSWFFDELFKSLPWPLKLSWWRKTVLLMARCPLLKIQTLDGRASHLRALNVDDKDLGCFQGNHVRVIMMDVVWSGLTTTGWRISKWDLQCCWAQIHWIIHFAALSFWILEAARCTLRFPCCEILYSQIVPNVHNSSQIVAQLFFLLSKKDLEPQLVPRKNSHPSRKEKFSGLKIFLVVTCVGPLLPDLGCLEEKHKIPWKYFSPQRSEIFLLDWTLFFTRPTNTELPTTI